MKKRFLTTCIAILTVFVAVFVLAACSSDANYDVKESSLKEGGKSAAELVKEICTEHPERTMGTGKDYEFLKYLSGEMASYGYPAAQFEADGGAEGSDSGNEGTDSGQGNVTLALSAASSATVTVQEFRFKNYYTNSSEKGYNLVYTIPAATESDKNVLLLASYDNCAGLEVSSTDMTTGQTTVGVIGGQGAYSNATGVATLLRLAYQLADEALPYNLTIAFVDCAENSWDGANELIGSLEVDKKNFICLNFNRLGMGDHTYIYSDENAQAYNDYFYAVADKTDGGKVFKDIPLNKQIAEVRFVDAQKTEYSHFAMYGDNLMLNIRGLAVASFVSFNWESFENPFYTEVAGFENIQGSSADTYDNLIERLGGEGKGEAVLEERLNAVVLCAATAISAQNADTLFGAVAESDPAASGNYADASGTWSLIVKIVLIIALVAVAVWLTVKCRTTLAKKQKEKLEKLRSEAAGGARPAPRAEDIFSMGGDDFKESDNDDKHDGGNGGSGVSGGSDGDIFEGF